MDGQPVLKPELQPDINNHRILQAKPKPNRKALTLKQIEFVRHYIDTKDTNKALALAGYKTKFPKQMAANLLGNPVIQNQIAQYIKAQQNVVIVSFNDKITLLWSIAQRCSKPTIEQVMGKSTVIDRSPIAIKAIEVLNTMQGHNAPAKQVNVNINSTIDKLKQCEIEYKDY